VHEFGGARMFNVIAIRQAYPGHARQAGMLAASCQSGSYLGRFVVVVDDDVDPTDVFDVMWAMCTRCDPAGDIDFIRRTWSGPLDPILDKASSTNSRAVIDACRPYERLNDFPPVARASPELLRQVEAKFAEVLRGVMGRQGTYLLTGNAGCQYVRVPLSTYAGRALLGKGFYTTISLCFQSVTLHKAIAENQVISVDQVHTNGTLAG